MFNHTHCKLCGSKVYKLKHLLSPKFENICEYCGDKMCDNVMRELLLKELKKMENKNARV